jgi:hypothetical protein
VRITVGPPYETIIREYAWFGGDLYFVAALEVQGDGCFVA